MHGVHAIGGVDLVGFVLLGVVGSVVHCVPMCSPFVLFVSRQYAPEGDRRAALISQLWYAAGRVATYATLGAAAGALGGLVEFAGAWLGAQRAAAVVAGVVLMASAGLALSNQQFRLQPKSGWLGGLMRLRHGRAPGHPLVTGMFLGLLPCGLLYTAVIAAVGRGSALNGAVALAAFGAGTVPALLGVSFADQLLARQRVLTNRMAQVFVMAMGAWFLWRGLAV